MGAAKFVRCGGCERWTDLKFGVARARVRTASAVPADHRDRRIQWRRMGLGGATAGPSLVTFRDAVPPTRPVPEPFFRRCHAARLDGGASVTPRIGSR